MKNLFLLPVVLMIAISACKKEKSDELEVTEIKSIEHTSDLVLIYHGGQQRPVWNSSQLKHYVFRENSGQFEWLFDGFLFLEIQAKINNKSYDFGSATSWTLKPTKAEWEWLIAKNFSNTNGPAAIEFLLDSLHKAGHKVPFKRKITIGIPSPIVGTVNWGSIDRQPLNFDLEDDRVKAVKWYVDQTISQFKAKNFKYLELDGFYWIPESASTELPLMKKVVDYVHETNHKICWIPYNYAPGADKWKEAGFDIAYQQSNYFFDLDKNISIMSRALTFARDNNMSMEMEFDGKIFQPGFIKQFYDYINLYDKYHVWDSPSVAYYEGAGAWMNMALTTDSEVSKAYKDLGDIVARRQKKVISNLELQP